MKLANDYAIGEESMHAGRRQIQARYAPESSDAEARRNRNGTRDRKRKEPETVSDLMATINEARPNKDGGGKKQGKWDPKAKHPGSSYKEIMNGPCKYHNHGNYTATHLTGDCTMNDKLAKEKAAKPEADANGDNKQNPPPPAGGAGNAGSGASGTEGAPKAFS